MGLSFPLRGKLFSGFDSFLNPYLRGDLPGRGPVALSLANKTGPDALAAASLQLSHLNRRSLGCCSRHSTFQVTRAQARGAGAAGSCSPRTRRQEAGSAAGRRSASFRSPRTLKGFLRAISWAPWLRALVTVLRGGAGSVEPSDIYGSPHAAAALSTRATQDQQSGEDPESGVRASGVEADRGEGSCGILFPPRVARWAECKAQIPPRPCLLRLFC